MVTWSFSSRTFHELANYGTIKVSIDKLANKIDKGEKCKMGEKIMLAYERTGNKESNTTLVFLHGSTMTKKGLLPLAEEFKDYNCIVFDLLAHGQSAGEEPEEVKVFAEAVEYSIQELQQQKVVSEQVILLGYSMGGAITCEVAIRKNITLTGIVLLSSGGDLKNHTPLVDALKEMPAEQFRTVAILGELFGSEASEDERERISNLFATTMVPDIIGYGDLMASNRYDNLKACSEISIPALMVHGSEDKIVLPTAAIETWKVIDNSQMLMIPYKGHAAIYEDTGVIRDKIIAFVEKCV